jgi:hypothetical protein
MLQWVIASMALVVVAVMLLYTALTEWCPLYDWLGINTREKHGGPSGGAAGHRGG